MLSEKNEKIKKAFDILQVISQDEKARMNYEAREAEIRDQLTRIKTAREEGKMEGKMEGKIEAARNLLRLGVNEEIIIKATELSQQEVVDIKRQLQN